jgi:hypothetical protein
MGGPKVTRLNPAGQPQMSPYANNLLQSVFAGFGPGASGQQRSGGFAGLMQGLGKNPLATPPGSPGMSTNAQGLLGQLSQIEGLPQWQNFGGQQVLDAAQPIFQRNLQTALGLQREQGPRFSSGQDLLGMQTSQRALQDFNLFSQDVLQRGQQTQLQALAAQQGALAPLLAALFKSGGFDSGPIYNVSPGLGQQLLGLAGQVGGAALGGGFFNKQPPPTSGGAPGIYGGP